MTPAVAAQSPNHWTTREFLRPPVLLTDHQDIGLSHDPVLSLDNLLGWLIELREILTFIGLLYNKGYDTSQMKRYGGRGLEGS